MLREQEVVGSSPVTPTRVWNGPQIPFDGVCGLFLSPNVTDLCYNQLMKKYTYVQHIKTFSIFIVVIYHCLLFYSDNVFFPERAAFVSPVISFICDLLYPILVPSFFVASGFLLPHSYWKHDRSIPAMIGNRAKRLLVPYYLYGALWLVPLYHFFDINSYGRPESKAWPDEYFSMIMGIHSDHLWFMWLLFWAALLFVLMKPLIMKKKLIIISVIAFAVSMCINFFLQDFPYFKLSQTAPFILCFLVGVWFGSYSDKLEKIPSWVLYLIVAVLFSGNVCYNIIKPDEFPWLMIVRVTSGAMFFLLFLALSRTKVHQAVANNRLFKFTDSHNYPIYCFGEPLNYVMLRLFYKWFGQNEYLTLFLSIICTFVLIFSIVQLQDMVKSLYRKLFVHAEEAKDEGT